MNKFNWFLDIDPFAQAGVLTIATALISFAIMFIIYCVPVIIQLVLSLIILYGIFYIAMKVLDEIRRG